MLGAHGRPEALCLIDRRPRAYIPVIERRWNQGMVAGVKISHERGSS